MWKCHFHQRPAMVEHPRNAMVGWERDPEVSRRSIRLMHSHQTQKVFLTSSSVLLSRPGHSHWVRTTNAECTEIQDGPTNACSAFFDLLSRAGAHEAALGGDGHPEQETRMKRLNSIDKVKILCSVLGCSLRDSDERAPAPSGAFLPRNLSSDWHPLPPLNFGNLISWKPRTL